MVVQTGGYATNDILSPFIGKREFSEIPECERPNPNKGFSSATTTAKAKAMEAVAAVAATANHSKILWCHDHNLLTPDKKKQQINGHVWKLIMDICHDFFSGMNKKEKENFLEEAMKAAKKIDQGQVGTPLTTAFEEWQSSPFPVNAGGTQFANKERHALFAILSMIPLDELKLMLSSFQDIHGTYSDEERAKLTREHMLQIDSKCSGTLERSYEMSNRKDLIIVMEASKWSIRDLINVGYLNLEYKDDGTWSGYPLPGHPALSDDIAKNPGSGRWIDNKTLACLFDPATRKGHGSVEHYLWDLISEKASSLNPPLDPPLDQEDFYNDCKDILKSSFQLFLDVFVNKLTGGTYTIQEMIIKSSISAGESDDNVVLVKINDPGQSQPQAQWFIHKLGSNSITKTTSNGTDGGQNYTVTKLEENGNGELLIPNPNEDKTITDWLPLKSFFKKLGDDTDFEIIFNNSYKSLGDWIQVVYLKKLNIYVNSIYALDVILAMTSNDKYVLLDALCNCLIMYATAVNVPAYALLKPQGGEENEEGDEMQHTGGSPTLGVATMHMVGVSIHKDTYEPEVYMPMFREYNLIIDTPIWPVEPLQVNDSAANPEEEASDSVYSFINKFEEYLKEKYEEYLADFFAPERFFLPDDVPPNSEEILKKIIKKIEDGAELGTFPTGDVVLIAEIDGFKKKDIHDYIKKLSDKDNQKRFLTELNRFCNALRAAFDKDLLKNMETHFNRSKEIGDNIGNDGAFLEKLKRSLFPSDNEDEPHVIISVSLTQILNHFKSLTMQCHQLYELNINELIKKPTQSMKDVLIDDYEFSERLHDNFKEKTKEFLKLHDTIKIETEDQVLFTKDQLHLIYENAIESIKEHAEGEITYIKQGTTGRMSRHAERRQEETRKKVEAVKEKRDKATETANVKFETIKGMMNDIMTGFGQKPLFPAAPLQAPVDISTPIPQLLLPPPPSPPSSDGNNNITQNSNRKRGKRGKIGGNGKSKKTRKRNMSSEKKRTDDIVEMLNFKKNEIEGKLRQLKELHKERKIWHATIGPIKHDEPIGFLDSKIFKEYAIFFRMHDEKGAEEVKILGKRKSINSASASSPGNIKQNDEPEAEQDFFEEQTYKVIEALHYTNEIVNFILQEFVEYLERFYLEQIESLDVMISYYTPAPMHITKRQRGRWNGVDLIPPDSFKSFTQSSEPAFALPQPPSTLKRQQFAPPQSPGTNQKKRRQFALQPPPPPSELDQPLESSMPMVISSTAGGRLRKSRKKSKKQLQHSRKANKKNSIKKNIKSKKINRKNKTRKNKFNKID